MAVDIEEEPATIRREAQEASLGIEVLERLVATLEGERDAISQLLKLSDEEREAVVHRQLERLLRVLRRQEQVYVTVTAMEESRRRAIRQWAAICGMGEELSLKDALPHIGEPHASLIRRSITEVRKLAWLLAAAHRRNRLLIERAFELGDATISFLALRTSEAHYPTVLECEA